MKTTIYKYWPLYLPRYEKTLYTFYENGKIVSQFPFTVGQKPVNVTDGIQRVLVRDPDWRVQIVKGQNAGNNYRTIGATVTPGAYAVETFSRFNASQTARATCRSPFLLNPWPFAQTDDDFALRDLAIKRLKTRIASRDKQMPVIAPIAELRDFRSMINSIVHASSDVVHAISDIKRTKGKSAYQYAAHAWLNYSFAITPTLSDIAKLAGVIDDQINNPGGHRYTERGVARKEWHTSTKFPMQTSYEGNSEVNVECHHSMSYRCVAGFLCQLKSSNDYSIAAAFGLEVPALVPTLWELTAFSWMFDYFTTMGDYLEDTFITDQTKTVYFSATKKYTCDMVFTVGPSKGGNIGSTTIVGRPSRARFYDISRSNQSSIPARLLRFKSMDEIGMGSVNKLLNLLSVLIGGKALSTRL